MKLLLVAGARPNFMKIAPIVRALARRESLLTGEGRVGVASRLVSWKLVHTGQHYDHGMSKVFFEELEIPEPDFHLECGSGSHAEQTARVMVAFEKVCIAERPDAVVVVGDINSTMACAITAKKLGIRVAHVEAGLRSGDMGMPEEINRIATDSISDWLFVTEKSGIANLRREGHGDEQIHFVGNVMIDTLLHQVARLGPGAAASAPYRPYAVVTLHRPSNVDDAPTLRGILEVLVVIGADFPVVFPVHPRPVTIDEGSNVLAGTSREKILAAYDAFRAGRAPRGRVPELWDGNAAARIVNVLAGT